MRFASYVSGISGPVKFDKNGDLATYKGAYKIAKFGSNGSVKYVGDA